MLLFRITDRCDGSQLPLGEKFNLIRIFQVFDVTSDFGIEFQEVHNLRDPCP